MIDTPFTLFTPYADRVRVRLYDRSDNVRGHPDLRAHEAGTLCDPQQIHGNLTTIVRSTSTEPVPAADGLATDALNLPLGCRGADCQFFVLYDPAKNVCGVLHAGWRGLLNGAIPAWIETFVHEWKCDPADLLVGIGPSLCLQCSEFTDPRTELPTIDPRFFHERLVDLRGITDQQLIDAGVTREHIERHPDCTKCHRERWWSLRGGDSDRLKEGYRNALTISLLAQ